MGILDDDHPRPGLFQRLSGFFRRGHDEEDDDRDPSGSRLPRVDQRNIPKSHDPRADSARKRKADDDLHDGPRKAIRLTRDDLPDYAREVLDLDVDVAVGSDLEP